MISLLWPIYGLIAILVWILIGLLVSLFEMEYNFDFFIRNHEDHILKSEMVLGPLTLLYLPFMFYENISEKRSMKRWTNLKSHYYCGPYRVDSQKKIKVFGFISVIKY